MKFVYFFDRWSEVEPGRSIVKLTVAFLLSLLEVFNTVLVIFFVLSLI